MAVTFFISEVNPSGSSSAYTGDWFEVTNTGTSAVDITGWKIDDNSNSFAASVLLSGVTSIGAGQSVVFIEGNATNVTAFQTAWFGNNVPNGFTIGTYSGTGVGLSSSGDAVNLFDLNGNLITSVSFGAASASFTFDNKAALGTVSTLSAAGVNGGFLSANSAETGSPGSISFLPIVTIAAQDANAAETASDPGIFRISRTGSTTNDLVVGYSIATGSGQATSADYTPTLTGTATIAAGQSFVDITITPVDDTTVEGNETVTLTLNSSANYTINTATATVAIADNDIPPTFNFSTANYSVTEENTSGFSTNGTVRITRTGSTSGTDTVKLVLSDGTAKGSAAAPTVDTNQGVSSSATPYIKPITSGSGVNLTSILSVGDSINGYKMVGIPDGLGAFDNGDGTFTLLMNHEIGSSNGVTHAHGATGAFVSSWVINKSDLSVVSGSDLIKNIYSWDTTNQKSNTTTSVIAFNRFCSADLADPTAYYNAATGLGSQERIFLNGEEGGGAGYQLAIVATGANKGNTYVLGKFNLSTNGSGLTGVGGWENALANPLAQDKTIVIGNNDGGTGIMNNSVVVYVGTKQNTGSEIDKAGLTNGSIKFINVTGSTAEIVNTTTRATNISSGTTFTLSSTASTTFSRPEDGAWNPLNPSQYFFVTTDRLDQVADGVGTQIGRSRLWRLNFTDITNPDAGGTIDMLLDGTEGGNMFDNMTIDKYGHILLQEDVGNTTHNGKIWQYDIATDTLKLLAKHDPSRFGDIGVAATAPFTVDEESSGIIDAQDILGQGWFLLDTQAHYTNADTTLVEGGQLQALFNPDTYKSYQSDYKNNPITVTFNPGETFKDVQIPVAGDINIESNETINLSLTNPSTGSVLGTTQPNAVLTIQNDDSYPTVNLSVSSSNGSEAGKTVITVTATASKVVSGNQTVNLAVTGTNITADDYTLSNSTITIPNGSISSAVSFTVVDDALVEGTETATVTISNPSAGITLGNTTTQNITITDNENATLASTVVIAGNATDLYPLNGGSASANINRLGGFGSDLFYDYRQNVYYALVDRGIGGGVIDYKTRVEKFSITTDPTTGAITNYQLLDTVPFTIAAGTTFNGVNYTTTTPFNGLNSKLLNSDGSVLGLSQDPEGFVVGKNGNFFVSDEYGPSIYEFSPTGVFVRALTAPSNVIAKANGTPYYAGDDNPATTTGRQSNRGYEGLAISPDGTKLYAMFQDPLQEEGSGGSNPGRNSRNVRILRYDVATGLSDAQYIYQLEPISDINDRVPGTANDFSASAQGRNIGISSLVAINNNEFLVLERDNRGVGVDDPTGAAPSGSKRVFKINLTGATDVSNINLAGTNTLPSNVTPVGKTLFLDIAGAIQGAGQTLPEKFEGLTIATRLSDGTFALIVATDNDFSVTQNSSNTQFDVYTNGISTTQVAIGSPAPTAPTGQPAYTLLPSYLYSFKTQANALNPTPVFDFSAANYSIVEGNTSGLTTNGTVRITRTGSTSGTDTVKLVLSDGTAKGSAAVPTVDTTQGISSSATPYIKPSTSGSGVNLTSILTVGDSINGYKMVGVPDGLGAFDNGDGTFTLLMNHEIGANSGAPRAHGSTGAFISKWIINKSDLSVVSGSDLIQNVFLWDGTNFTKSTTQFNRFCSADLAPVSAFYNSDTGLGTTVRIFLNGEESGAEGRAFAHIASGANAGTTYELPSLGNFSWENAVASPTASNKTVVAGLDDSTGGQVYFYIGNKTNTGTDIEKAGLNNGKLYGVVVAGLASESDSTNLASGTRFGLADLGNVQNTSGANLQTQSITAGVTAFLRPEDGAWAASNPKDFYFATTNGFNNPSRLWRLRFDNPTNPESGGTIEAVLNGTEGQKMFDNMTIDKYGHILLQEDVGNNAHIGKIWQYDIATDTLTQIAQHDSSRFITGAANFLTQDEESSGIIDAQDILGPGWFLLDTQAHYTNTDAALVEGGQLQALFNPDTYNSYQSDYKNNPITVTFNPGETFKDVQIPVAGDTNIESNETVNLSLSNPSGGTVVGTKQPNAVLTIENDDSYPTVNLSVSTNSGTEAGKTVITVTGTASKAVSGNQTVNLAVTGTNITTDDYTLSNSTITIPNGSVSSSVTFTVVDDALVEGTETATVAINNPSAGITLGNTTTQNITITDNDSTPPTLTQVKNDVFNISGESTKVQLKVQLSGRNSNLVNELGVYTVDDQNGTINNIAPGATGYAEAALARSKVIFSVISNNPTGFDPSNVSRLLELDTNKNLRFYLVKNNTVDNVKKTTSTSDILFSSTSIQQITASTAGSFTLGWKDGSNATATQFNDLVVNVQATNNTKPLGSGLQGDTEAEVLDLTGVSGSVSATFTVNREAGYDNFVGFYRVTSVSGGIDTNNDGAADLLPGQAGYLQAAINQRVAGINLTVNNQGTATYNGSLNGGGIFAPFIIINGRPEALLDTSTTNDPAVYFPYLGANTDKTDHMRLLGDNVFGFEDLVNGGDKDYNDVIVKTNLTIG